MAQTTCTTVNSNETIVPSVTECFNFEFSGQADFNVTIDTTGVSHVMVFAQHVPTEFERSAHYFIDAKGVDIEPVAEVSPEPEKAKEYGAVIAACLVVNSCTLIGSPSSKSTRAPLQIFTRWNSANVRSISTTRCAQHLK